MKSRPPVRQQNHQGNPNPRLTATARSLINEVVDRRHQLGLRQVDVANLCGLSPSQVADFENLRNNPSMSRFLTIAESLGLRIGVTQVDNDV